jgi:excisionase family DNA binding protein
MPTPAAQTHHTSARAGARLAPLFLSIREAARLLGIEPKTVHKWIGECRFPVPTYKLGRRRLIRYDELQAFVASLEPDTPAGFTGRRLPSRSGLPFAGPAGDSWPTRGLGNAEGIAPCKGIAPRRGRRGRPRNED